LATAAKPFYDDRAELGRCIGVIDRRPTQAHPLAGDVKLDMELNLTVGPA